MGFCLAAHMVHSLFLKLSFTNASFIISLVFSPFNQLLPPIPRLSTRVINHPISQPILLKPPSSGGWAGANDKARLASNQQQNKRGRTNFHSFLLKYPSLMTLYLLNSPNNLSRNTSFLPLSHAHKSPSPIPHTQPKQYFPRNTSFLLKFPYSKNLSQIPHTYHSQLNVMDQSMVS